MPFLVQMSFLVLGMAPLAGTFWTPLHPLGLSIMVPRSFFFWWQFFCYLVILFCEKRNIQQIYLFFEKTKINMFLHIVQASSMILIKRF
jgi:hypothetical protein